ncbi:MAG: flagellar hook-length control protein FliK [Parvularculaceae bacterium]|nr:flagellar hook-length control protein FliK [Parvularculaceae bacterium]
MTDIVASHGPSTPARARSSANSGREGGDAFSYALASASLERGAAQSLEAHGARPDQTRNAQSAQTSRDTARAQSSDQQKASQPENAPETAGSADYAAAEKTPSERTPESANAAPASANVASVTPGQAAQTPPAQAKAVDAPALRTESAIKAKTEQAKAPRIAQAPPALKEAFAEVLARRLEKTSVFDLRLDPPDLGRVEGRLTVNDDGKAVLSLTFDNQSAFDLFSRDEQALRTALHQAGLEFGSGDFTFAFRETAQPSETDAPGAFAGAEAPSRYDTPQYFAPWSAGALDIRI